MEIRHASKFDLSEIRRVYLAAFGPEERELVAQLAVELLDSTESLNGMSLVACQNERVCGHVAFSPLTFDSGIDLKGVILSPLAVEPTSQRNGIGRSLVNKGFEKLRMDRVDVVLVYGDPNYYGQFGFQEDTARSYHPPFELQFPHGWLGLELRSCDLGGESIQVRCVKPLSRADLW